jgi:hypothetical protein
MARKTMTDSLRVWHSLSVQNNQSKARAVALTLSLAAACTGALDSPSGPSGADGPELPNGGDDEADALNCTGTTPDVGRSALRRLSNTELQLTLQDLFGLAEPPSVDKLPPDITKDGFRTFADVQAVSAQHLRSYADTAKELADGLLSDSTRRARVVGCDASSASCLRDFVARFGKLAFRRPLASDELDVLVARVEENALDTDDRIRFAIQSLLISPYFMYRLEVGDAPDALSELSAGELASRLSFGLWGRAPSLELLTQAEQGGLDSADGLREVAEQMLGDDRASYFYTSFFRQWLGYDTLRAPQAPPPDWSQALLPEMQNETDAVLRKHAFGTGSFLEAFTTNETELSPSLASYYGLSAPSGAGSLSIPATDPRANAGILGHASLMSMKTDGDSIAVRGNWLRRTFFCKPLTIPPEVASDLGDLLVGLSPVQIVEKRNSETGCKGCHALIDPIGVGLAKFDATGRFDPKADIAQYGITPSVPDLEKLEFQSIGELSRALADSPEVAECLSQKLFVFMHGREPDRADGCEVQHGHEAFEEAGSFRALLSGIVGSPSFRLRRPADTSVAAMSLRSRARVRASTEEP